VAPMRAVHELVIRGRVENPRWGLTYLGLGIWQIVRGFEDFRSDGPVGDRVLKARVNQLGLLVPVY
jgi:hypothetical protein